MLRELVERACAEIGLPIEEWAGVEEVGNISATGKTVVQIDPEYFRPTEVDCLQGDASKAREKLGWKPEIGFDELVRLMVREDLQEAERDHLCQRVGFKVYNHQE